MDLLASAHYLNGQSRPDLDFQATEIRSQVSCVRNGIIAVFEVAANFVADSKPVVYVEKNFMG